MKQEKKIPYNLRLPERLKTKAEKQAKQEKRSLNNYIILAIEDYIAGRNSSEKAIQQGA